MNLTVEQKAQIDREVDEQNQELLRKLHCQRDIPVQAKQEQLAFGVMRDERGNGRNQELMPSIAALEHGQHRLQEQLNFERSARCEAERKTQMVEVERDFSNLRADAAEARETKMRNELLSSHHHKEYKYRAYP